MSGGKAYTGSCHCGAIQYQIKLTFPTDPAYNPSTSIRIYKCNCTVCQSMGLFHCRPVDAANDFILTAPLSIEDLGDYQTGPGRIHWYFCKACGVRPFAVSGKWEQESPDVGKWAGKEDGASNTQKVWRVKPHDDPNNQFYYLSVNAVTLKTGDDGVDLKEWHEKGWIRYVQKREKSGQPSKEPYACGMY